MKKGYHHFFLLTVLLSSVFIGLSTKINLQYRSNWLNSASYAKFLPVSPSVGYSSLSFFSLSSARIREVPNHSPIMINGNEDFRIQATTEGWDLQGKRDGTSTKPFVIAGYVIRANSTKLVSINNTSLHFVFSNNILTNISNDEGPLEGLECINVTNGVIENNYIQSDGYYIPNFFQISRYQKFAVLDPRDLRDPIHQTEYLFYTPSNKLQKMPYFYAGLRCDNSQLVIRGNTISGFFSLIHVEDSSNLQISNNSLKHSLFSISLSNNSHNNLCMTNTFSYSHQPVMIGGPSPFASRNNTFCMNFFNTCLAVFNIGTGQNNKILNNTILNCHIGILLSLTRNNLFSGNVISNTEVAAVFFPPMATKNAIEYTSWNNFSHNLIFNCKRGLNLQNTQHNIITANHIYNQESYGILVMYEPGYPPAPPSAGRESSCYNNITNNVFYNNSGGDVILENYTSHNIVLLNKFLFPTPTNSTRILDNGSCNYVVYNYYANWAIPDTNFDGIVDLPYFLDGSAENLDPFPLVSMNTRIDVSMIPNLFTCRNISHTSSIAFFFSLGPLGLILGVGVSIGVTYFIIRKKAR